MVKVLLLKTLPDIKKTHPREDALRVSQRYSIFAVADGVTRDVYQKKYFPNKSPASLAAQLVSQEAVRFIEQSFEDFSLGTIKKAFILANSMVHELNKKLQLIPTDYSVRDLAGAVMSIAVFKKDKLFYGFIGDCGVALVRDSKIILETPDEVAQVPSFLSRYVGRMKDSAERTYFARSKLRNKPYFMGPKGERAAYGVLTGEEQVEFFLKTGSANLQKGDFILIFSDGIRPFLTKKDFLAKLFKPSSLINFMKTETQKDYLFGHERTFILIRY